MAGLAHRAALVSFARLCNQAIGLFSPIILVRLLPVSDFGAYRSFFLYFNVVSVMALSAANWSLLYFIPRQPAATWRIVRTCARIVAISSLIAAAAIYAVDYVSGGHVIGERIDAVLIYMVLFVNLDFWEHLALARKRPLAVLGYTVGRLVARMTAVITTAALTHDVDRIILALICVEAVRLVVSGVVWRRLASKKEDVSAEAPPVREILAQCLPLALSVLVNVVNQQSGGIIVDRLIGEVGLAYLTVGTYVSFVVSSVRNSISDVLLPEMSGAGSLASESALNLWRRSTVVFAILLLPVALVLGCFAAPVIGAVFSEHYLPAVPIFQVYLLMLVRECFDFDLALRAAGQTSKALSAHVLTLVLNLSMAIVLVHFLGVIGAAIAAVTARTLSGIYLAHKVAAIVGVAVRAVFPWGDLSRVMLSAGLAGLALLPAVAYPHYGWAGIISSTAVFAVAFALLLRLFDVAEIRRIYAVIGRRLGLQHP